MLGLDQNLNLPWNTYIPSVEGKVSLRLRYSHQGPESGRVLGWVCPRAHYGCGSRRGRGRWSSATFGSGALYTMDMRPVCFLSDFGLADDFAGTCKGVMLRIAPGLSVVDLTHEVPDFGVETGAEILQHATRYMPADAVYLAVVDPGVGTKRRGVALRTGSGALLVGPDNGLLVLAAESLGGISGAVALTEERFHLHPVSNTFHGRDVFAPVAAHLAAGAGFSDLGMPSTLLHSRDRRPGVATRRRRRRYRDPSAPSPLRQRRFSS